MNVQLQALFHVKLINFFGDPSLALPAITFITGWAILGFSTLIFASALTNINRDYIEAAAIDGADGLSTVRFVILPLLSPTILFMTLLTVLFSAQWTFTHVNVLTQGGPRNATTNIYYLLYNYGFRSPNIGWSSAAAVLMFLGFAILAVLFLRLANRFSFYDS